MRLEKGWYGDFYYLICVYRTGTMSKNELIAKWEKYQKEKGITVYKKSICSK